MNIKINISNDNKYNSKYHILEYFKRASNMDVLEVFDDSYNILISDVVLSKEELTSNKGRYILYWINNVDYKAIDDIYLNSIKPFILITNNNIINDYIIKKYDTVEYGSSYIHFPYSIPTNNKNIIDKHEDKFIYYCNEYDNAIKMYVEMFNLNIDVLDCNGFNNDGVVYDYDETLNILRKYKYGIGVGKFACEMLCCGVATVLYDGVFGNVISNNNINKYIGNCFTKDFDVHSFGDIKNNIEYLKKYNFNFSYMSILNVDNNIGYYKQLFNVVNPIPTNKQLDVDIIDYANYDLSIILPFYKKIKDFKRVLPINYKYYQRNGIEVIIVMDEQSEEAELLDYIKTYPFINWRVIINRNVHSWRNPTKALNVGIKHSSKKYVMVMSPESEFITDGIKILMNDIRKTNNSYSIGTVTFSEFDDISYNNPFIQYGSIMVNKSCLYDVGGYDESIFGWGGDDDNLRYRLDLFGMSKIINTDVRLVHREEDLNNRNIKHNNRKNNTDDILKPTTYLSNNGIFGNDFNEIIYNYSNNKYSKELCCDYIKNIIKSDTFYINDNLFNNNCKVVALVQSYNEQKLIKKSIDSLSKYVDGIILLDDGSVDDTYELVNNDKIIMKIKKDRQFFDDITNRNMLLDLGSFIKTNWFIFVDVDEMLDDRYSNLYDDVFYLYDSIIVKIVNLWDSEDTYRVDYPFTEDGFMLRTRMFRNIGRMQINTNKTLHFNHSPHHGLTFNSNIVFKHYSMISKEDRLEKYNFYKVEDSKNDQKDYSHIIAEDVKLLNIAEISF